MGDAPPGQMMRVAALSFSGDPNPGVQRRELTVVTCEFHSGRLELLRDFTWSDLKAPFQMRNHWGTLWAFDFPLSFPHGFIASESGEDETWDGALAWAHENAELTLAVGRPPFWGRHKVPRPKKEALAEFGLTGVNRATERVYRPAKSLFQVAGPDAVGTAALRGMAWLHRSELRRIVHGWPFDGPVPADHGVTTVAEVLPRAFWPDIRIEDPKARAATIAALRDEGFEGDDALWATATEPFPFKAVTSACGLTRLFRADPHLLARTDAPPVTDPALRYEGWALGPLGLEAGGAGGGS